MLEYVDMHDIQTILLAARWAGYSADDRVGLESVEEGEGDITSTALFEQRLARVLGRLAGRRVIIIDEVPYPAHFDPNDHAFAVWQKRERPVVGISLEDYAARNRVFASSLEVYDVHRLQPQTVLCKDGFCPAVVDGVPRYRDSNHITNEAASVLQGELKQRLLR